MPRRLGVLDFLRRAALGAILLAGCADPQVAFDPGAAWPAPEALDLGGAAIWVVSSADDTISVLDVDPLAERARVPIGLVPVEPEGPSEIAASPDGRMIVGLTNDPPEEGSGPHASHAARLDEDGYTLALDGVDASLAGRVRVDPLPSDVAVLSDGTILQAHFQIGLAIRVLHGERPFEEADTRLETIDRETMEIERRLSVCPAVTDVALSADEGEAYLACYGSDEISVVELGDDPGEVVRVSLGPLAQFAHPYYSPRALAVSPADGRVWVSCWMEEAGSTADGRLYVFDPAARAFVDFEPGTPEIDPAPAASPYNPMQGVFDRSGARLFVPYRLAGAWLRVIDTATGELLSFEHELDPAACVRAHAAALSSDESTLWVLCEGDHVGPGKVIALDPDTLETKDEVAVGVWPTDFELVERP